MPKIQRADKYQKAINDAVKLAVADTVGLMKIVEGKPLEEAAAILRDTMPIVTDTYGAVVGELATSYYDESRAAANLSTTYKAVVADTNIEALTQDSVGYTISKIAKGTEFEVATATLSGSVQRIVNDVNRQTISYNIVTDPDGTMYQRVASANSCAFCLTIAAKAELMTSDWGKKYHDDCRCRSVPVFTGEKPIRMPYYDKFEQEYDQAKISIESQRFDIYPDWEAQWKASGGRMGKNLNRDFLKAYPELSLTTENILSGVRSNTGRR
jgi:hypothetical protein